MDRTGRRGSRHWQCGTLA